MSNYLFYNLVMKRSLLILTILILCFTAKGQGIIAGSVLDENKESLAGAHIFLKETSFGTIANGDGKFRLKDIPDGTYTIGSLLYWV